MLRVATLAEVVVFKDIGKNLFITDVIGKQLEVDLNWVIVRDGPGTWAKNADWDEYLVRVRNVLDAPVRVTGVHVYDSMGNRHEASGNRKLLVKSSRRTARQYDDLDVNIKAGANGATLLAASGASYVASNAIAVGVLQGSLSTSAAGAAVAGLAAVPVLAVGGIIRSVNNDRVSREIARRCSSMPVVIDPEEEKYLNWFFGLVPSPQRIEITYQSAGEERVIVIDASKALQGLHIASTGAVTST